MIHRHKISLINCVALPGLAVSFACWIGCLASVFLPGCVSALIHACVIDSSSCGSIDLPPQPVGPGELGLLSQTQCMCLACACTSMQRSFFVGVIPFDRCGKQSGMQIGREILFVHAALGH